MNTMICMTGEPEQVPFLSDIAELGAGIELGSYGLVGVRSERDWQRRLELHEAVRARFQGTIALHGPFVGMEFAHMDHLIRNAIQRRLDMTFDAAVHLRTSRVVLHSGYTPETEIFALHDAWLDGNVKFWHREIRRWADVGIEIVLENDTQQAPDPLVQVTAEVDHPFLGLCLDIGHQHMFSDLDTVEWVRRMGKRLVHLHLHDNDGTGDHHWPLGRGTIDFEPFYAALLEHVPQATLSLEVQDDMEVKMDDLRKLMAHFASKPHSAGGSS